MKKQLELLLAFIACCLLFVNCQKDDLESTQDLQQSKIIYRKIPFADLSSRSPKTIIELNKTLQKSKTNDFGRGLSENNSYTIDSTSVVYIDNGEGYSSYTFSVLPAQNDTHLQNIVISNYSNGETKAFLAEYELNKTVEQIDDDNFISSIKKTEFYNLNDPNMVYGRGSMCVDLGYEDILNVCEGNLVTESQDPECFNSDGTPKTKVVFIIIASGCSGSGGDGYGSPSHGDTSPGTSDGPGSGGGGTPNPNPSNPITTNPEPNPNHPAEPVTVIGGVITSPTLPSPTGFKTFSAELSVSQQQWLNLPANASVKNQIRNYLDQNGYSESSKDLIKGIINLSIQENFDAENLLRIINQIENECVAKIIFDSLLYTNSSFQQMIKNNLISSPNRHIAFTNIPANLLPDGTVAVTSSFPQYLNNGDRVMSTEIASEYLNQATDLGIVVTIYHELLHSYIIDLYFEGTLLNQYPQYSNLKLSLDNFYSNPSIDIYQVAKDKEMHDIYVDFIDIMGQGIFDYCQQHNINNVDLEHSKNLIWGSLEGYDVFTENLTNNEQMHASTIISNEDNNHPNAKSQKTCNE